MQAKVQSACGSRDAAQCQLSTALLPPCDGFTFCKSRFSSSLVDLCVSVVGQSQVLLATMFVGRARYVLRCGFWELVKEATARWVFTF